jgi:hypothetical protein
MNIIVERPQLVRTALLYLNMNFGDLTRKTSNNSHSSLFEFYANLNNEIMIEYDVQEDLVYVHWDIWSKIESLFQLNYNDTQSIMKVWLGEKFKELEGIKPIKAVSDLEED